MGIQPLQPLHGAPLSLVAGSLHGLNKNTPTAEQRVGALLMKVRGRVTRQTLQLGADRSTRRDDLERLKAKREAQRIIRRARLEEAAAEARVRENAREAAALENLTENHAGLGFTPSELAEILQTAQRLNIQA